MDTRWTIKVSQEVDARNADLDEAAAAAFLLAVEPQLLEDRAGDGDLPLAPE